MRKNILLISIFSFAIAFAQAQKVEVVSFKQFEQRLKTPSDTVVIYNFWATWCRPCVAELPGFMKYNSDNAGKKIKVVLVSMDFKSKLKSVKDFAEKNKIAAEVLLLDDQDYNSWLDKVSTQWGGSIPATAVVYGPKAERKFHEGPMSYEELEQFVKPLIKP